MNQSVPMTNQRDALVSTEVMGEQWAEECFQLKTSMSACMSGAKSVLRANHFSFDLTSDSRMVAVQAKRGPLAERMVLEIDFCPTANLTGTEIFVRCRFTGTGPLKLAIVQKQVRRLQKDIAMAASRCTAA